MDVVTAFLNGDLDENIYMEIPEGLKSPINEGMVCKLLKSLYGLKQAPRQWYAKIHNYLVNVLKFKSSMNDPCLYVKKTSNRILIVALYVDDLLILGNSKKDIAALKGELSKRFEMKDLGPAKVMLGIEITRDRTNRKIFISQKEYTKQVLNRFQMANSRAVSTPMDKTAFSTLKHDQEALDENVPYRQAIGSLIYLVTGTRPDLAFSVRRLSQHLENPQKQHWSAVKRILRYLKGTETRGILFDGNKGMEITGYSDSDYAAAPLHENQQADTYFYWLVDL